MVAHRLCAALTLAEIIAIWYTQDEFQEIRQDWRCSHG